MDSFKSKHSTGGTEKVLDSAMGIGKPMCNVSEYTGAAYDDAVSAATAIPERSRSKGKAVAAKNSEGETKEHVYGAAEVSSTNWTKESNWKPFCPCPGSGGDSAAPDYKNVIYINQTIPDPAGMITGDIQGEAVTWIRENSHRVVAKKTGEGEVTYARLMDTDGTKFYDGSDASSYINQYDVFMKMPEFWYYGTEGDNAEIHFSTSNPNDDNTWCHWDPNTLIGVYEAYNNAGSGNKLCSISNVASTGSISQVNFKQYARNKGAGYQLVDWQMHCVMCALFYAWYGNTNSQAICGSGTGSYWKETGQTNSLGMTDTTTENGNSMSINFWGLENWWGNKYEWMDNIISTAKHNVNIEAPDPYPRSLVWSYDPTWGKHYKIGKYLDMSSDVSDSGSDTTYYCDQNYGPDGASRVARRSLNSADTHGGVSYANAYYDASSTDANGGSRLAFRGTCIEETDLSIFASI